MHPDLEADSGLDKSKLGASRGTQRWIESTTRSIGVDQVDTGSAKWIGPKYNFPIQLLLHHHRIKKDVNLQVIPLTSLCS